MAEKTIPWWRKALRFALEGIRTGWRLLKRPEIEPPAQGPETVAGADETQGQPTESRHSETQKEAATQQVEFQDNEPKEEALIDSSSNSNPIVPEPQDAAEAAVPASSAVEPVPASEPAPAPATEPEVAAIVSAPEAAVADAELEAAQTEETIPVSPAASGPAPDPLVPEALPASEPESAEPEAAEAAPVEEVAAESSEGAAEETPPTNVLESVPDDQGTAETLVEAQVEPEDAAIEGLAVAQEASAPEPAPVALAPAAEAAPAPPSAPTPEEKAAARVAAAVVKARAESPDGFPFSVMVSKVYDGPLDLLLDLIRKQDIDIYDIPIARITAQFLAYVNQLKAGDVDVAGEFIYTASLLIHIKSKMLLPRTPSGSEDAAEDPRRELVERLLEHERFKNAAQMLQQKQMLEAATWTNPGMREFRDDAAAEPEIAADTVDLIRIFREILERARSRPVLDVQEDTVTVGQMIRFLGRRLTMEDKPVALRKLLSQTRSERALIAMFLALLELVRMQAILLRQDRHFSDIFVKKHTGFDAVMNEGMASARDDWR